MVSKLCRGRNDRRNREFVIGDLPHSPDTRKDGPNSAPTVECTPGAEFRADMHNAARAEYDRSAALGLVTRALKSPQPQYVEGHPAKVQRNGGRTIGDATAKVIGGTCLNGRPGHVIDFMHVPGQLGGASVPRLFVTRN